MLALGADVDNLPVSMVVNYDIPVRKDDLPDSGLTGHFGRKGTAISLIADQKTLDALAAIERYFSESDGGEMIQQAAALKPN